MERPVTILDDPHPAEEGLDTAIARALLLRAGDGLVSESFRLHVPGRVVAFGKHDTLMSGYPEAVAAARRRGFQAVERLAGGRAAVFHERTLSFSWTIPGTDPTSGVTRRFEMLTDLIVASFARLGISTEVGEVPGEYCPGRFSVHHGGTSKLMGVGQRLTKSAAHIGGVIVVGDSGLVNAALGDVYPALGVWFDPGATGSLQDIDPTITMERARLAVLEELATRRNTTPGTIDSDTLALARRLTPEHVAPRAKR